VTAAATGHAAQTKTATVLVGTWVQVDFLLEPAPAAIRGTVLDNLTGQGIPNATVSLSPGGLTAMTGAGGAFMFPTVAPGTYTLSASAAGYTSASQTVSVAPGQTLSVVVRLRTLLGL
jgi:protocatechuate 3,4-dioxygenase beta subunit